MAILATNLTKGTGAAADTFDTASITPVANRPVLLTVYSIISAGAPASPTPTGCNLTWTLAKTVTFVSGVDRLTVFVGVGTAPSAGAVTLDFAGVTQTTAVWAVDSFQNGDGSAAGANFVVQSVSNTTASATSLTATMAAFASASNASFGAVATAIGGDIVPGSGFAELAEQQVALIMTVETEWRNDADTSIDATFGSSAAAIIGIELLLDVTGPTLSSLAVAADGLSVTATLSESGCIPASGAGGFSVNGLPVASWAVSGTTLTLTLARPMTKGAPVTVTYDTATSAAPLTDVVGNQVASLPPTAVTNSSTVINKGPLRVQRAARR